MSKIIDEICMDLEVQIEEAKASVVVDTLPTIDADPTQIQHLFQNLIGNSFKFARLGVAPHIHISSQSFQTNGHDHVTFYVKDNGIGIQENYQERIFEVFERLHSRSEYEGTGVGLAICRKIVERHHGCIRIESVPNQLTTFIITLPVKQLT